MGKSDSILLPWYKKNLPKVARGNVAFLGSTPGNFLSSSFLGCAIDFFDIQLNNWEINQKEWDIQKDHYDLVVCTRCAYFSSNPFEFLNKCKELLTNDGLAFIDWGLGDHWRFENFKVGWVKDEEHEYAVYKDHKSYLYSCAWNSDWEMQPEILKFKNWIEKFGYSSSLGNILIQEVPEILTGIEYQNVDFLSLWPENPQLYISTIIKK